MKFAKHTFYLLLSLSGMISAVQAQGLLLQQQGRAITGEDKIVAIVEDRIITKEEILRQMEPFLPQIKKASASQYEYERNVSAYINELVQSIIDRELIVKEFKGKGMTIPQSYLDAHFDDFLNSHFSGDRAEFLKFLQAQGKTMKQFREEQENELIVSYMQQQQRQTVAEISPTKIIEYYEENKNKWYSPASVKISQITLKSAPNGKSMEEITRIASEIVEKLRSGEEFSRMAKRHSQDDKAKAGGDWGWYKKGELNTVLDAKAFSANKGEVLDPIALGNMIFIMRVDDKKDDGIQPIDEVRSQIEWIIADQNARAMYKKWVEGLRKKAYIKYYQ